MTCADCIALTSEYVDGYLEPVEVAAVEAHTSRCAACARYLRVLGQGVELVREIDEIQPSEDFGWQLSRRLREVDEAMADRTRSARSGAALAVAIAGMVAFLAWSPILGPGAARGPGSAMSGPATANGGLDDEVGGWEWWYGGQVPGEMKPPSANNAFPGPYSPLRVDPPIPGGGTSRTVLTSLIEAE